MAPKGNILSFDEAKRTGARRSSAAPVASRSRSRSRSVAFADQVDTASVALSYGGSSVSHLSLTTTHRSVPSMADGFDGGQTGRSRALAAGRDHAGYLRDEALDDPRYSDAALATGARSAVYGPEDYEEDVEAEGGKSRASKRAEKKRARAKSKADRKFEKQFGGSDAPSEGGPRAAVYKGEMGSKQRKAARMQGGGSSRSRSRSGRGASRAEAPKLRRAPIVLAVVAGLLVMTLAFLYPSAQQYYQATRENARLQAEYAALEQRNAKLAADVADLQTESGIEARAHDQLGWVRKGEETANVRGIEIPEGGSLVVPNVVSGDVEPPETWYSPFLDVLFGVETEAIQ